MALHEGPSLAHQPGSAPNPPSHPFSLPPSAVIWQEGARRFLMQGCWQVGASQLGAPQGL